MPVEVGINGSVGSGATCSGRQSRPDHKSTSSASTTSLSTETLAHLLKYDSVFGRFSGEVKTSNGGIAVDGDLLAVLSEEDPAALPWADLGAEVVIESTGLFKARTPPAPRGRCER